MGNRESLKHSRTEIESFELNKGDSLFSSLDISEVNANTQTSTQLFAKTPSLSNKKCI